MTHSRFVSFDSLLMVQFVVEHFVQTVSQIKKMKNAMLPVAFVAIGTLFVTLFIGKSAAELSSGGSNVVTAI
jgi:hypothetical protein